MLLSNAQFNAHKNTQGFLCRVAFQLGGSQYVLVPDSIPPQVQDFAVPLPVFFEVPFCLFLHPGRVLPNDSTMTAKINVITSQTAPAFVSSAN